MIVNWEIDFDNCELHREIEEDITAERHGWSGARQGGAAVKNWAPRWSEAHVGEEEKSYPSQKSFR